jgi:3-phosphoshikimate 1-carboxyvinyltransferase
VRSGHLRAFSFDATDCPDLFPPLVALASRCSGVTELYGASRLGAKESDRAAALSGEFEKLGLKVVVEGDLMTVRGSGGERGSPGKRLRGSAVSSHGDHRIAMAVAVAALAGSGPVAIEGTDCVAKSWPEFFEALASIS